MTEKNVFDLERSINELDEKKRIITNTKRKLETDLGDIKNKLRTKAKISPSEYNSICKKQDVLKAAITQKQDEINVIVGEIRRKSTLREEIRRELKMCADTTTQYKLIELKNYYINFAADRSRISSMRAMAAEFAEKIEIIIKTI